MDSLNEETLEDEGPQETDLRDLSDEGEVDTVPCPICGAEVYEDAQRCPHCGGYITGDLPQRSSGAWWWVVLSLVIVAIAVYLLTR